MKKEIKKEIMDFDIAQDNVSKNKEEKMDVLKAMEKIVDVVYKHGIKKHVQKLCEKEIKYISEILDITPMQSIIMSIFLDNFDDRRIDAEDFTNASNISKIAFLRLDKEINELIKRKYIFKYIDRGEVLYYVPDEAIESIKNNKPVVINDTCNLSFDEFFKELEKITDLNFSHDDAYDKMFQEYLALYRRNMHLNISNCINDFNLCYDEDIYILLYFCHRCVNRCINNVDLEMSWKALNNEGSYSFSKRLKKDKCQLIDKNLIEFCNKDGMVDTRNLCLTEYAINLLLPEQKNYLLGQRTKGDLIKNKDLAFKEMVYNEENLQQVERLTSLLEVKNFKGIQKRLSDKGLRKGFACLFYGEPGTGKTETVYQIAKNVGRDIYPVNVQQIKSKWVGDSEKNIKNAFTNYKQLVKVSKVAPILLFNEADAIISKRGSDLEREVEKSANAIQNIILEELENLDGILIATTNLVQNFDRAFERRFLYKINFVLPNLQARAKIWQALIKELSATNAEKLAKKYNFSGGQIENISRKCEVDYILNGKKPNFEIICKYCDEERYTPQKNGQQIGFRNSIAI